MSVYDLKDHPDFRFRPGTIVIRVANLLSNQYPAGQIMDNYPSGQVRVWWANSVISFCWPQDLFRLGDYDSDEGEMWDDDTFQKSDMEDGEDDEEDDDEENGNESDSSWVTETEEEFNDLDSSQQRYNHIGKLIQKMLATLLATQQAISPGTSPNPKESHTPSKVGASEQRGVTKKLLVMYKDLQ